MLSHTVFRNCVIPFKQLYAERLLLLFILLVALSGKEMATHSSILAWEIAWGPKESDWRRTGNPLQDSCLETPVDKGAWWPAVHGVAQNRTWLKWLSMHACMHWRRKWQPTPVFLPGEFQGRTWLQRPSSSSGNIIIISHISIWRNLYHTISHSFGQW